MYPVNTDIIDHYLKVCDTTKLRDFIIWLNTEPDFPPYSSKMRREYAVPFSEETKATLQELEAMNLILEHIKEIGLTYSEFAFLDEKPGWFGMGYGTSSAEPKDSDGEWHCKLRRVRNCRNDLFDILAANSDEKRQ